MAPPTDMAIQTNSSMDAYRVPQAKKQRMEQEAQIELDLQQPKPTPTQEADQKKQLQELTVAVDEMNRQAQNLQRSLQFSVEQDLDLTVVKVVNPNTDEVVRQIPSEEFIAIAKAFEETRSLLFDAEA